MGQPYESSHSQGHQNGLGQGASEGQQGLGRVAMDTRERDGAPSTKRKRVGDGQHDGRPQRRVRGGGVDPTQSVLTAFFSMQPRSARGAHAREHWGKSDISAGADLKLGERLSHAWNALMVHTMHDIARYFTRLLGVYVARHGHYATLCCSMLVCFAVVGRRGPYGSMVVDFPRLADVAGPSAEVFVIPYADSTACHTQVYSMQHCVSMYGSTTWQRFPRIAGGTASRATHGFPYAGACAQHACVYPMHLCMLV